MRVDRADRRAIRADQSRQRRKPGTIRVPLAPVGGGLGDRIGGSRFALTRLECSQIRLMDTQLSPQTPASTMSGHPLEPVYGPNGAAAPDAPPPGTYPYTRGLHPEMYRTRLWTMRMFAGFGSPEDTNQRFRDLLAQGQTGLSTAFDMPALMGYDPDHPMSAGEVGREGVSAASRRRLPAALRRHRPRRGLGLDDDLGPGAGRAGAVRGRRRGARLRPREPVRHAPDRHPQGVHRPEGVDRPRAARHAAGRRPDRVLRDRDAALAPGLGLRVPHPRGRRDGRPGAGVHASPTASPTWTSWSARGVDPDSFLPRFSFFFNCHSDFFEEIAKLRAARRLWARADARAVRRQGPAVVAAAHAHADLGRVADGAAAAAQHRPHGHRGARPACSAARSRCTPTPTTRRTRSRRSRRPPSRCARSRCSPTRPAPRAWPTRSAAPGSSSG